MKELELFKWYIDSADYIILPYRYYTKSGVRSGYIVIYKGEDQPWKEGTMPLSFAEECKQIKPISSELSKKLIIDMFNWDWSLPIETGMN
jgi:hypothetical protein